MENLTLDNLYSGKATKIKGKEYLPTEAYIDPFINICKKWTDEFIVDAVEADQLSIINNEDNMIYNRVYIQAVLPDTIFDNHKQVLGMIYALDTKIPVVKLFTGGLNMACTNLCVFNPDAIQVNQLEENVVPNFNFLNNCGEMLDEVVNKLHKITTSTIPNTKEMATDSLGYWIDNAIRVSQNNEFAKVKLATSDVITAYKNLFLNSKSDYYQNPNNAEISVFDVYNSFTDTICNSKKSDMITKPEKVLLVSDILGL